MSLSRAFVLAAAGAASVRPAFAQQPMALTARLDAVFTEWDDDATPGCAAGIARDGRPILLRTHIVQVRG